MANKNFYITFVVSLLDSTDVEAGLGSLSTNSLLRYFDERLDLIYPGVSPSTWLNHLSPSYTVQENSWVLVRFRACDWFLITAYPGIGSQQNRRLLDLLQVMYLLTRGTVLKSRACACRRPRPFILLN